MSLSPCGELVRKHDPDRFLLSLFVPPDRREDLWALYAFNYEIARTREVVTDTNLGLIRLQWWRDALGGGAGEGGPVLAAVLSAMARHDLPRGLFDSLIYAREFDLEDRAPASLEGMVNYADFTSTPLMDLSLKILSRPCEGARDIATAYALTGLLRAVPAHLRQRRCYLPADRIPPVEELYEGRGVERLKVVVKDVVEKAESLFRTQDDAFVKIHAKLAKMYLGQIRAAGYDVFSPRLKIPPLARGLRLLAARLL